MDSSSKSNARAKASGGFIVMDTMTKNKHADVYYRTAIDAEMSKLLGAILGELEKVYTTVKVNNAKPQGSRPSISNITKLIEYYKTEYFSKFLRNSYRIIKRFLDLATKNGRKSVSRELQKMYGDNYNIPFDEKAYKEIFDLMLKRNVGLIQNTTLQTLNNIENIVYDGVTTGQSWKAVQKDLSNQKHIAKDRIKRIARDQTGKANEALNELSQRSAGIEFFEWRTAEDERVSTGYGGHKQLDGKIYKWGDVSNYPVIDSYGHRGLPHERVNCRCTALAVILRKGYEAKQNSDGSWRIIKGRI